MDVTSCQAKLKNAYRVLMARWEQTSGVWDDRVRDEFEKSYIEPLEHEISRTLAAMNRLSGDMSQAEHDCR